MIVPLIVFGILLVVLGFGQNSRTAFTLGALLAVVGLVL